MAYDWHKEAVSKALQAIAKDASQHIGVVNLAGWYRWFESNLPEAWAKYISISERINAIYGDMTRLDEFKSLMDQYVEAHKYAIKGYVEHENLKGTQSSFVPLQQHQTYI
jgi:hypothetical protein